MDGTRLRHFVNSRKPSTEKIVRHVFGKFKCRDCGRCCRNDDGPFRLGVTHEEARSSGLILLQGTPGVEVLSYDLGVRVKFHDRRCSFLNGGCSIYPKRPTVCRTFPFVVTPDEAYLSSLCPPVAQLKNQGIELVYYSDFSDSTPILSQSFARLGQLYDFLRTIPRDFAEPTILENQPVFPIY